MQGSGDWVYIVREGEERTVKKGEYVVKRVTSMQFARENHATDPENFIT